MLLHRGDIVVAELDPTQGSEQRGTRPCLVVQNDIGNETAPTTIIVPLTTAYDDELYPFEVLIHSANCALHEDSVALCNHIRTVSVNHRIVKNLGGIPPNRMEEVDRALQYSLRLIEI